jgi:hypothetical protein
VSGNRPIGKGEIWKAFINSPASITLVISIGRQNARKWIVRCYRQFSLRILTTVCVPAGRRNWRYVLRYQDRSNITHTLLEAEVEIYFLRNGPPYRLIVGAIKYGSN